LAGQGVVQFELTQVASANAVVDMLAETTDWQLILLDVYMPDVCGTEILQAQF
jgi:response regulator of citrate/malate metabolism